MINLQVPNVKLTPLEVAKVLAQAAAEVLTDAEAAEQSGETFQPDMSYIVSKVTDIVTRLGKEALD